MNNKTKTILFASLIAITVIPLMASVDVFADTSYPSWSTHQASPDGWSCSNECYAASGSNGEGDVYAKSNTGYESRTAQVHNNAEWGPTVTTSALEITTSNSIVGMEIDVVYKGDMTTGFGSIAELHNGLDLYKKINGSWYKVSGCYKTVYDGDNLNTSKTHKCTASNAGLNEYRAGSTHKAYAFNYFGSQDTIVDFKTGNGYEVETNRLEICEGSC